MADATKLPWIETIEISTEAVAQAATATLPVAIMPFTGKVNSVKVRNRAALTGADTDTRKLSLLNGGATGLGTTEVAALQFDSGTDRVALAATSLTNHATAANQNFVAGDLMVFKSAAVGDGLADGGGLLLIEIERT